MRRRRRSGAGAGGADVPGGDEVSGGDEVARRGEGPGEPVDPDVVDIPEARAGRLPWKVLVVVAAGGAIGASLRYELSLAVTSAPGTFPLSTFAVNVSGSLVLGVLVTLIVERWPPTVYLRPFAAIGIIGAYTTWSTFMVDTDRLVQAGRVGTAIGYVVSSLVAGLAATWVGICIGRRVPTTR